MGKARNNCALVSTAERDHTRHGVISIHGRLWVATVKATVTGK